jgi:hypothetical protein
MLTRGLEVLPFLIRLGERKMRKQLVISLGVAAMVALCLVAIAQERASDVVGPWEGSAGISTRVVATMEISADAGAVKWKYSFKGGGQGQWGDADGTVASFSPPTLELSGTWTAHSNVRLRGTGVRFAFTLDGDQMKGTGLSAANNTPFAVSLMKK